MLVKCVMNQEYINSTGEPLTSGKMYTVDELFESGMVYIDGDNGSPIYMTKSEYEAIEILEGSL